MKLSLKVFGVLTVLMILLFVGSAYGAIPEVSQLTYSPSPAVPGNTMTVLVQLQNNDNTPQQNVTINVANSYPFTVKASDAEPNPRIIGSIDAHATALATFTVTIDPTAQNQTYNLEISVATKDEPNGKKSTFPILLSGKNPTIKVISVEDGALLPGQEKEINLTLQNVGTSTAYDVIVEMQEDRTITATGAVVERDITPSGAATAYVASINPGEQKSAKLTISVSNNATIKNYTQPIKVSYRNSAGERTTDTSYIGLRVFGKVDFDATLKSVSGNLYAGQKGDMTIEIFNKGLGKADFTLVEISADDAIIDSPKQFIGSLGPNDVDTAKTGVTFNKNGSHTINVTISYTDTDATTKKTTIAVPINLAAASDNGMGLILPIIVIIIIAALVWNFALRKKKK